MSRKYLVAFVAIVLVMPGRTDLALAQAPRSFGDTTRLIHYVVAIVDSFPYAGADAVVLRRVDGQPREVVLVRAGRENSELLSAAIQTLAALRATFGDIPSKTAVYRVQPLGTGQRYARAAENWLQVLAASKPAPLEGLGRARQILLTYPKQGVR